MSDFTVPQFEIRFLVGNEHVGASDGSIASLIGARCVKAGMTEEQIGQCGNYTISSCAARRKGRKQHMDRISLWYCEGASDKVYEAEIVPVADGFQVNF